MRISHLTANLRGPWMICPESAAFMAPVLRGALRGLVTEFDKAPEDSRVSLRAASASPASGKPADMGGKTVHVTHLVGTMMKYDSCEAYGTKTIAAGLREADRDPDVIGHVIIADSGGGSASSVDEMADAIRACSKPVVAFVDGMAASACIYALSYCDRIIAHRETDRIGCIGTLIEISGYPKFHRGTEGYITARIYADEATEKNADYEAALEGDFKIIKESLLNPLNDRFVSDMRRNRPAVKEEQLHGSTYFASETVGTLIDAIGSFEDAVDAVAALYAESHPDTNPTSMENNYPTLLAIAALAGLVFDADGSTTLQAPQLAALEGALAAAAGAENARASLSTELDEARATIAQRDARIAELETSLAAALERAENPAPEAAAPSANPEAPVTEPEGVDNFDDALQACRDFLKK